MVDPDACAGAPTALENVTDDAFFGGRLILRQRRDGHRSGTDAVLLAAAAPSVGIIADLGAGAGLVGLTLALRGATRVMLVEREAELAALAAANAAGNGLSDRVQIVPADVVAPAAARRAAGLLPDSVDGVATNPPFFGADRGRRPPDALKSRAHGHGAAGGLDAWLRTAAAILRPSGVLTLIHRADHLGEVLRALDGRFGAIAIRPVAPRSGEAAVRIMVQAIKGSRAPPMLLAPLVLHESDGRPSADHASLAAGRGVLSMRPGPTIVAGGAAQ